MIEKQKITKYPNGNKKTETYENGDTFVTKHFYNAKDAYVKEFISLKDGIQEIKHFTQKGVLVKLEHFVENKRQGEEIKYIISQANKSIKSSKIYDNGKLHGQSLTYNLNGDIIKHEVFALGKLTLKYLRDNDDNNDITSVVIIDKESVTNLPKNESDRLQSHI
jgi:antitoxin component YwqK of YwqJK toxin-antitoxin module